MPTIVKWKYVKLLMAELQKPEYDELSDGYVVNTLNAPIPTGNMVDVPDADPPEQVPELSPSFAQEIGIGEVFVENISQLRVYLASGDEDEIKYDLAGYILSGVARRAHGVNPDVTTEEIVASESYKLKAALVAGYAEIDDPKVLEAVLDESLQVLSGGAD